jgi:hypothetical protein
LKNKQDLGGGWKLPNHLAQALHVLSHVEAKNKKFI